MTFIEHLKSIIEQQLEGWGPQELVSVGAELGVAACVVVPLVAAGVVGRWAIRKYGESREATAITADFGSRGDHFVAVKHRS